MVTHQDTPAPTSALPSSSGTAEQTKPPEQTSHSRRSPDFPPTLCAVSPHPGSRTACSAPRPQTAAMPGTEDGTSAFRGFSPSFFQLPFFHAASHKQGSPSEFTLLPHRGPAVTAISRRFRTYGSEAAVLIETRSPLPAGFAFSRQPQSHIEQNVLKIRHSPIRLPALAQTSSGEHSPSSVRSPADLCLSSWQVQPFQGQPRQEKLFKVQQEEGR